MPKLLFILFFVFFAQAVSAQTYLIPHVDFVNLRIRGGAMVDKWYLASRGYWDYGSGIGFDVRHHFKKFYLQVGFTHSENMPNVYFENTNVQKILDPDNPNLNHYFTEFSGGGTTPRFLRLAMPMLVGKTLKRNRYIQLRGMVGLMPAYRFADKGQGKDWNGEPQSRLYNEQRQYVAINKLVSMYESFELHAVAGLGLDIWKFSIDVRRSVALTDLAHDIQFEGKTYPFSWKGDQVTVSLGWKFRIDKNRPRKQKRVKGSYF